MDDRELLEAAARAVGLHATQNCAGELAFTTGQGSGCFPWNPLTNDGDAFRLAVKLNLLILPYPKDNAVRVTRLDMRDSIVSFGTPPDPCDATRRAIVMAAAEMGAQSTPPVPPRTFCSEEE